MLLLKDVNIKNITISDKFWSDYLRLVKEVVIPYQWEALNDRVEGAEPSHAIKNYRIAAGLEKGEFHGYVFQDSDVTKWIEAASYRLAAFPDEELEHRIDEVVELIGKAQQPDGYLNTYFTIKEPENRFVNERDRHELYCAGHLIEAAVAYYEATGKQQLLNIACKFTDYIDKVFGKEEGKKHGYPGHQVMEMALLRLYRATGNKNYVKLCKYFIDERGTTPHYFVLEREERIKNFGQKVVDEEPYNRLMKDNFEYNQAHLPVRQQAIGVGHAVRAVYMYTAMADLAGETGDEALLEACRVLWKNVTQRQMYITGGIGSDEFGEAFSFDYDLPGDRAYAETCASVGLVFWAKKMLDAELNSNYGDEMERALYNGTISGMSLDGNRFFYVNPLEVWPEACKKRHDTMHVEARRQKWFGCSCCPPNIARLITSIGKYIYTQKDDSIYIHLFIGNTTTFDIGGNQIQLSVTGNYPWEGNITITVDTPGPLEFKLAFRLPGWCKGEKLLINGEVVDYSTIIEKGYVILNRIWNNGDKLELNLPMPVERVYSNPNIHTNSGKVALQRGPVVYCVEEADNGENLHNIMLSKNCEFNAFYDDKILGGVTVIKGKGKKLDSSGWENKLYSNDAPEETDIEITAIPYFAWENRQPGEMLVWMREDN